MWGLLSKFLLSIGPSFLLKIYDLFMNRYTAKKAQETRDNFAKKEFEDYQKEYAEKMASDELTPEEKEKLFEENIKITNSFRTK